VRELFFCGVVGVDVDQLHQPAEMLVKCRSVETVASAFAFHTLLV
jgi:hypothetical protein